MVLAEIDQSKIGVDGTMRLATSDDHLDSTYLKVAALCGSKYGCKLLPYPGKRGFIVDFWQESRRASSKSVCLPPNSPYTRSPEFGYCP